MPVFSPFDPRLKSNPYEVYREIREADPVSWSPFFQSWFLSRYQDVLMVLRDHTRFSSNRQHSTNTLIQMMEPYRMAAGPIGTIPPMISVDPPTHTRMRNLVNRAFTPRVVEQYRPHLERLAAETIDGRARADRVEVMSEFAIPFPVTVIAEVLGVPASDRNQFKLWSTDLANALLGPLQPPESWQAALKSANDIADYFRAHIREHRERPRDDLLSAMIAAEETGDFLSEDELVSTCILLLAAGNETTTNLIGNGMLALLNHPEQLRLLQSKPELLEPAVQEMLRYDSSVQMTARVVVESLELAGRQMEAGQVVMVGIAAANRDPEQFPEPDTFDITRFANRHVSFGQGIHYCVGAPLALAEAQIAFRTLLQRFPEPVADFDEPAWGKSFVFRGLESLPLRHGAVQGRRAS